jgi:hypothetical protein
LLIRRIHTGCITKLAWLIWFDKHGVWADSFHFLYLFFYFSSPNPCFISTYPVISKCMFSWFSFS